MRIVNVILMGFGMIGQRVARMIAENRPSVTGVHLCLRAIADSRSTVFAQGIQPHVISLLAGKRKHGEPIGEPGYLIAPNLQEVLGSTPAILVDATNSDRTGVIFERAIELGHRGVTANKKLVCGRMDIFHNITMAGATRFEATVGAGIPVIAKLQSMIAAGDEIRCIRACASGTLGYIFWQLGRSLTFAQAVETARKEGYTEPNPADDLSGMDVLRKLIILGRVCGFHWADDAQIRLPALLPIRYRDFSAERLMKALPRLNDRYKKKVTMARSSGSNVLRYVATTEPKRGRIQLLAVPAASPLGRLEGPENGFMIHSKYYPDRPLFLSGPGAGAAVTAEAVMGDIIAHARELTGGTR